MSIRDWFGGKEQPWWQLARREPLELFDAETGEVYELKPSIHEASDIEGLLVDFRYTDAKGKNSRRSILCVECRTDGEIIYVTGFCPFREDYRTFRVDRMRDLVETRSGRKILNENLQNYFGHYARPIDDAPKSHVLANANAPSVTIAWKTPTRQEMQDDALRRDRAQRARRDCIAGLRILVHLAMADNIVTAEEINVETSYLESRLIQCGFEHDAKITDWLLDTAAALTVPPRSFTIAVNAVAKNREYFRLVLESVSALVQVQGAVSPIAKHAVETLLRAGIAAGWISRTDRA